MDFIKNLFKTLWNSYKLYCTNAISIILLIIALICLFSSVKSCSNYKDLNNNNIVALTDSINYYKSKNGDLVAEKTLLEGDFSTLKLAYNDLYQQVKDMGVKEPTVVVKTETVVQMEPQDTVWIVDNIYKTDTITGKQVISVQKDFAFNNEYRSLEGNVNLEDTVMSMTVTKDEVYADITMAVQDNKVYVTSTNPYVKFNDIKGLTIPKQKQKKWGIGVGPQIGYGYDFTSKKAAPYVGIGISLQYNFIRF